MYPLWARNWGDHGIRRWKREYSPAAWHSGWKVVCHRLDGTVSNVWHNGDGYHSWQLGAVYVGTFFAMAKKWAAVELCERQQDRYFQATGFPLVVARVEIRANHFLYDYGWPAYLGDELKILEVVHGTSRTGS